MAHMIFKIDLNAFSEDDINNLMQSLEYASYEANRGYGMTHDAYMSLFPSWSDGKKAMFQAIYEANQESGQ